MIRVARTPDGADPDGCMIDEEFRKIPSEHYFDLTARFNATDNMTFTFDGPEPVRQPAEGGGQHDRFDHLQQR